MFLCTSCVSGEADERFLPISPLYSLVGRTGTAAPRNNSKPSVFVQPSKTCLHFELVPALVAGELKHVDPIFLPPRYWQVMILSCFQQRSVIYE